jgi:Succinyl-CoA synthetase, beta subunit
MRLQEHQAKALFAEAGIPVPESTLVASVEAAVAAARKIDPPVAVKAQVRVGGRGKAGGIEVAEDLDAVRAATEDILGMEIGGRQVESVLIEAAVDATAELYVGVTVDRASGQPVAIVSREGGVDIETVAAERPAAIAHEPVDPAFGLHPYQARRAAYGAGLNRAVAGDVASVLIGLYELWADRDGREAEINPLLVTDGNITTDSNETNGGGPE